MTRYLEDETIVLPRGKITHIRLATESSDLPPVSLHMLGIQLSKDEISKVVKDGGDFVVYDNDGYILIRIFADDIQDCKALEATKYLEGLSYLRHLVRTI